MKNKCIYLFLSFMIAGVSLFGMNSAVAAAAEQSGEASVSQEAEAGAAPASDAEPEAGEGPAADADAEAGGAPVVDVEAEAGNAPAADADAEAGGAPVVDAEAEAGNAPAADADAEAGGAPVVDADAEAGGAPAVDADAEAGNASAADADAEAGGASASDVEVETFALPEREEFVSSGQGLIDWLESHKYTGGTVKLADHIVLDGDYSFYPGMTNMPDILVDTDWYTITVTGQIEISGDHHLFFAGQSNDKAVFYVAENGLLSMQGVSVESDRYAAWQEEGAGLVTVDCHISGNIHYADTPFVMYSKSFLCAVVESGQTANEALPAQMSCTVNRQGRMSNDVQVPVAWNLEGTEKQQEERRRFKVQGSYLGAGSAEPAVYTVVYNDYPLTFTDVTAAARGCLYTFQGGFTVPEENLPFTVMAEYSFDGENWLLYEEQSAKRVDAGFYIACKRERDDTDSRSNIYIRLQWNNNGDRRFSNVLCYAADDLDSEEDIGGSRGGGTSITNPPDEPQEEPDGTSAGEEEPGTDTDRENSSAGDNRKPPAGKDQTHGGDGGSGQTASDHGGSDEAFSITDHSGADMDQQIHAESSAGNAGQGQHVGAVDGSGNHPQKVEPAQNGGEMDPGDPSISEKEEAVPALSGYEADGDGFLQISERALRAENRRINYLAAAAGFVLLSASVGAAVCFAHFHSGTKR